MNHNSPFARIFMIHEGEQEVSFNGKTYLQKPGSIYIVPPFTSVNYSCSEHCIQFYMILSAELTDYGSIFQLDSTNFEFKISKKIQTALRTLINQVDYVTIQHYDPASMIYSQELQQSHANIKSIQELQTTAIAALLLAPFLQNLELVNTENVFFKATKYIEEHLQEPISLNDLAKQVNLAPTYFSDKFSAHFKQRPMQYVQKRRIEQAQVLLTTTRYSVDKISHACGFKTSAHFCRTFKHSTKMTPKQYRGSIILNSAPHT